MSPLWRQQVGFLFEWRGLKGGTLDWWSEMVDGQNGPDTVVAWDEPIDDQI